LGVKRKTKIIRCFKRQEIDVIFASTQRESGRENKQLMKTPSQN